MFRLTDGCKGWQHTKADWHVYLFLFHLTDGLNGNVSADAMEKQPYYITHNFLYNRSSDYKKYLALD